MDKLKLLSPAKINIYLKITGKRADGYHELKTLFQAVDIFDELTLEKAGSGVEVLCDDPAVPGGEKNIAHKAAALMVGGRSNIGVRITIRKRIPSLAGLGGGSGNAAFTLTGIDRLFGLKTPKQELARLALLCGADVPFFLNPGRALAEGIGERLITINQPEKLYFVLVNPGIKKPSTKDIFEKFRFELTNSSVLDDNALLDFSNSGVDHMLFNDLESVVAGPYPVITQIKSDLLEAGANGALMSGSGLTVFGTARSFRQAEEITARLAGKYPWVKAATSFDGQEAKGGDDGDYRSKDSP